MARRKFLDELKLDKMTTSFYGVFWLCVQSDDCRVVDLRLELIQKLNGRSSCVDCKSRFRDRCFEIHSVGLTLFAVPAVCIESAARRRVNILKDSSSSVLY